MSFLGTNWKTNLTAALTGLLTLLMGIPTFITAITAWSQHQPVDWRSVGVSTALAVITAGLAAAKDSTTHSTQAQVTVATQVAAVEKSVTDSKNVAGDPKDLQKAN